MPTNFTPYILALGAGVFYAISALLCKRGLELGAGTIRSLIFSNWIMALFFIPYPLLGENLPEIYDVKSGILLGCIFFISQLACFFALEKGDASLVTPVMGAKSVFVAFFVVILDLTDKPPTGTWIATVLTAIAVFLIGWPKRGGAPSYLAIFLGLTTAAGFGLTDAMVPGLSQKSEPLNVLFVMFATVGVNSFLLVPFIKGKLMNFSKPKDTWMLLSCIPMGIQAVLMSLSIGLHEVPAEANVFYACRGIWVIILTAWIGKRIGLKERESSNIIFSRRLIGAILLIVSIYFTL